MKTRKRPKLYVGKWGTGKTTKAKIEAGGGVNLFYYASDITIDDPYSIPKDYTIIIEEVNHKPDKDKILDLIHAGVDLILTSHDKKSVPKPIINACDVKMCGAKNHYQTALLLLCKNNEKYLSFDDSIWNIMGVYIKTKDRDRFYRDLVNLSPPPMQLISWAIATFPDNEKLVMVSSMMNKVNKKYFYALFAYSWSGGYRKIVPPKRKEENPYQSICLKLGFKADETYILKRLISNPTYASYVSRRLTAGECKVLKIKKEKRSRPKVRPRKKWEDFI